MQKIDFEQAVGKTIRKMGVLADDTLVIIFDDEFVSIEADVSFDSAEIETTTYWTTRYFRFREVADLFGDAQAKIFHDEWVAKDAESKRQYRERELAEKREAHQNLKAEFGE